MCRHTHAITLKAELNLYNYNEKRLLRPGLLYVKPVNGSIWLLSLVVVARKPVVPLPFKHF